MVGGNEIVTVLVIETKELSPLLGNQKYDLTLSWQNLTIKVKRKKVFHDSTRAWLRSIVSLKKAEEVAILNNVSGEVRSGNLVAVLGSSGCGKTSLLAAASSRIKGTVTGKVLLCGCPVDGSLLTRISGFVPQQDITVETLTTKEHLQFMSWMRLDRKLCDDTRSKWIEALLLDLNLAGCEDTPISALSGGERKRLSLAVELLTDPPLLFCDEPTTGLDSYNASTVVEKLNHVASRGKAVLCSIHQPTSDTLSCFHKIILLSAGCVAFQGTLAQAYTFFSNQGFVCPPCYNPAEFFIQKLSVIPGEEEASSERIKQICEAFSAVEQDQSLQHSMSHPQVARNCVTGVPHDFQKYITIPSSVTYQNLVKVRRYVRFEVLAAVNVKMAVFWVVMIALMMEAASTYEMLVSIYLTATWCKPQRQPSPRSRKPHWHTQVYWLMWRSTVDSSQNKSSHLVQIAVFLVTSLMLSLCFMNTEAGTQRWIQDIRGLLYLIISEVFFTSAYSVFNTFPQEIPIFLRESELYAASAYYFSKMVILIPRAVIEPMIYLAIIFGVVDFAREDLNMFFFMAVPVVIVSNSATAYGCMLSGLFESPAMAAVTAVPVDLISLIMAGIFYNIRVLPASVTWVKYLSQFYYSNEALAVIHWQEVDYLMCPNNTNLPCLANGQQVLDEYGFNTENLLRDLVTLAVFYIVLHFIGFLGVWRRSKRKAAY